MFVKACLAGVFALALSSTEQVFTPPPPTFVQSDYIEKINCAEGSGTGFKLADGRWVTARHVSRMNGCQIDGLPILVTYSDDFGDISIFFVPGDDRRGGYEVDCGGFQDRSWYHGMGHADGLPVVRSVPVMFSAELAWLGENRGWSVLIYNRFIPGQSGGPVVETLTGKVVGIVNAFNPIFPISFSRELKRTVLCSLQS